TRAAATAASGPWRRRTRRRSRRRTARSGARRPTWRARSARSTRRRRRSRRRPTRMSGEAKSRTIRVAALARVEGEGALHLRVRGTEVERATLEIYEPPRFFEGLLRGRAWTEAP